MIQALYTLVLYPLLFVGFWLLSFRNEKIRKGFEVRRGRSWLKAFDKEKPLIWFHVASGELEYAKPVMRELKRHSYSILVTYFSPTVIKALEKTPEVDLFVPMPWDTPWHWNAFLKHYSPRVLAIARTDTWPNMVWQTKKKSIPSILFSATLPSHSGRAASFLGRLLYGRITEDLSHVSCVAEEDKINFQRLDADLSVSVDGDTRFDQVLHRLEENRPRKHLHPKKITFVAGSTWPEDEAVLIPALVKPVAQGLRAIIVPHEPTLPHLSALEEQLKSQGLKPVRYSTLAGDDGGVILVDQVGILAELYKEATIAFVGGSFKKSIHSVMESAACGCHTLFGPYHFNNREALSLKRNGHAFEINDSQELESILLKEIKLNEKETQRRKNEIIHFIKSQTGVSSKISQWIQNHSHSEPQP